MALSLCAAAPATRVGASGRPAAAARPAARSMSALRPALPAHRRPASRPGAAVRPVASLCSEPERTSSVVESALAPDESSRPTSWWQALTRAVTRMAALSVIGLAVLAASPFSAEAARQRSGSSGGRVGGSNFGTSRTATATPAAATSSTSATTTNNHHHHHTTVVHSTPSMGGVVAGAVVGSAVASAMAPPMVVASPAYGYSGYHQPAVVAAPVAVSSSYFMYKAIFGCIMAILLLVVLVNVMR